MSVRVFHVGLMKSGTTYLQEMLSANRELLVANGWSYPGRRLNQQHACYSLCGSDIPWLKKPVAEKLGDDLKKKVHEAEHSVIISAEALSTLSDEGVDRFVTALGRPSRVVFTIRSLYQTLPSAWQQYLKGGGRTTFNQFLERLQEQRTDLSGFWRTYAYGHSIRRWRQHSEVDVVVVPSSSASPTALLERFQEAAGLPQLDAHEVPRDKQNASLSLEAAQLLRHLNKQLPKNDEESDRIRNEYLKRAVMPQLNLEPGTRIHLPRRARSLIESWNNAENDLLKMHATRVHGSVEDLTLSPQDVDHERKPLGANSVARLAATQIAELLR